MIFLVDRVIRNKAYPNLARHDAQPYTSSWRQFDQHYPYVEPLRLFDYFDEHRISYTVITWDTDIPKNSCYPIGLSFFNFEIDYFSLLPNAIQQAVKHNQCKILFYYHEGDNPLLIKQRLDSLAVNNGLPSNCYRFISGNTSAKTLDNFLYFPDHEYIYQLRNRHHAPCEINYATRQHTFTALSRTHKWWRATIMADLFRSGLLNNAIWSYHIEQTLGEEYTDNPIEVDTLNIRPELDQFLTNAPYYADHLDSKEQNDHSLVVPAHFDNAYFQLVVETHFDADGSKGSFLTEKTFKPIKHGQPFVVAGTPGTLATLRDLGYRVFDHAIDNSYDTIINNTERWQAVRSTVAQLVAKENLHEWFLSCRDDLQHNQKLFNQPKVDQLNKILKDIYDSIR
jgi:hypothetical protein